jgi:hypothetical protein
MNVVKDLAEANTTVSLPWFTYKDNGPFLLLHSPSTSMVHVPTYTISQKKIYRVFSSLFDDARK